MAKQVRVRRDTLTNLLLVVPADGEIAYNLTDDRIHMGDGVTAGGVPHPNFKDIQKKKFDYAVDSGAADAYVIALSYSPGSYSAPLTFKFKASNSNTGASTINVNGLGVKNILKYVNGTLGNLTANDIVSGGIYEITYDGTQFQLQTYSNAGLLTVKQGDLATAQGTFSSTVNATATSSSSGLNAGGRVLAPGGQYGFEIEVANMATESISIGSAIGWWKAMQGSVTANAYNNYLVPFMMEFTTNRTVYGRQRYVTSSPPFEDARFGGAAGGFFFALVNSAGEIVAHYFADVPPWAYNGPTNIRADHICPMTGKKYRKALIERSLEEILDGAKLEFELQEITQDLKNADMDLIPHPFGDIPEGHTVVLLDPTDERIARMIEYQNAGGSQDIIDQIQRGFIQVNNDKISRRGLIKNGFELHRLKFKYSGKGN